MPAYFIASYDVSNLDEYAKYNPGSLDVVMATMTKHGGKVLSAGTDHHWIAGERKALVVIEFPDADAARAWEADPDYQEAKAIRLGSTANRFEVIASEFTPPSG